MRAPAWQMFVAEHIWVLRELARLIGIAIMAVVIAQAIANSTGDAQRRTCHRLNVHRAADDSNDYAAWKVDVLLASALVRPSSDLLTGLRQEVQKQTWTPLTPSCENPGDGMRPVRFSVRQPTPADLTLRAGE